MQAAWIGIVHFVLFLICVGYALFLNQRSVYEWYTPNRTWVTVVGGDTLIGLALAMLCAIDVLPWLALLLYGTLHIAAGTPIIVWQLRRANKRERELEGISREL